jgi:hypothetical protein
MNRPAALSGLLLVLVCGAEARADGEAGKPVVTFLVGDAGRAAIVDESIEPYFSLLQPLEMAAKTGSALEGADLAAQRAECKKRYQAGVIELSDEERQALTALVERVHAACAAEYPLLAKTPWSFIPLADTLEGGLPHTRGRSIVLPQVVLHMMVRAAKKPDEPIAPEMCGLLAEEQAHVLQRLYPELFAPLYTEGWGFLRAKDVASDAWLDRRRVTQPDGVDVGWLYPVKEDGGTTTIQPLMILREGPEPLRMPADLQLIAVTMEKKDGVFRPKEEGERPVFRDLTELSAYQNLWGGVEETFHPNEIFASLFAMMVVKDHFQGEGLLQASDIVGKDLEKLRTWCRKSFVVKGAPTPK